MRPICQDPNSISDQSLKKCCFLPSSRPENLFSVLRPKCQISVLFCNLFQLISQIMPFKQGNFHKEGKNDDDDDNGGDYMAMMMMMMMMMIIIIIIWQ